MKASCPSWSRRLAAAVALALPATSLVVIVGAPPAAATAVTTIVVKPSTVVSTGWLVNDEGLYPAAPDVQFVTGPSAPSAPDAGGSVQLSIPPASISRPILSHAVTIGLGSISSLAYTTYTQASAGSPPVNATTLQLEINDGVSGLSPYQGRLVFEPSVQSSPSTLGAWQSWDALAGTWWGSRAPFATVCPQSTPCTWGQVLSAFPSAFVNGFVHLRSGGPWSQTTDNVGSLTVNTTTWDFEPETACTTTCYVDAATGSDSYGGDTATSAKKTIQAGIDAVQGGGTVRVLPGNYSETATNRSPVFGGTYDFGLFFGDDKAGVSVIGVDSSDLPITNAAALQAHVTTNSTANFGPDGVFVQGDNVTIQGLDIGQNTGGGNKTLEVLGNGFSFVDNTISDDAGSLYFNDARFDSGTDTSHIQAYTVTGNRFLNATSIDLTSGAGYSGPVSGRTITGNTFDMTNTNYTITWPAVSFNGTGTGVPWFLYGTGGAIITGNTFQNNAGAQWVRARGTYDNSQFDWSTMWLSNTFDRATVALATTSPFAPEESSYTSGSYQFNHVRMIGAVIGGAPGDPRNGALQQVQPNDTVLVKAGTYNEDVTVSTAGVTVQGENYATTTVVGPVGGSGSTVYVNVPNVTITGFTITRAGNNAAAWNTALNTAGIAFQSSTGGHVFNNVITKNRTGIDINNHQGVLVEDNDIVDNRTGLVVRNNVSSTNITHNRIDNNWTLGIVFIAQPPEATTAMSVTENSFVGDWYGGFDQRAALPAHVAAQRNWWGTTLPLTSTSVPGEPGYAGQIPVEFGGIAVPPLTTVGDMTGAGSGLLDYSPWLGVGTNFATGPGFRPAAGPLYGIPTELRITTQPVLGQTGGPLGVQPVVQATDAAGNLGIGFTGTVTAAKGIGSDVAGTLDGPVTANAVAGVATFAGLSISRPLTYTLAFTSPGLTGVTSDPFTVNGDVDCTTVCYVDGTLGNDLYPGSMALPKKTVQGGVDAVTPGGTVHVVAGTYSLGTAVSIAKSLSLLGPNVGISPNDPVTPTTANPARVAEATLAVTGANRALNIGAANVIVDGFRVTDSGVTTGYVNDTLIGAGTNYGGDAPGVAVRNNVFDGVTRTAVYFNGPTLMSGGSIDDNRVVNPARASGCGAGATAITGCGFQVFNPWVTDNLSVQRNVFLLNAGDGGRIRGINASDAQHVTIKDNTFAGKCIFTCVAVTNSTSNVMVEGNTFHITAGNAFQLHPTWSSGSVTVRSNIFDEPNDYALAIDNPTANLGSVSITRNAITAGGVRNAAAQSAPATCNWWGANTGPVPAQNSGPVTAYPWLGSSVLTGPCTTPTVSITGPSTVAKPASGTTTLTYTVTLSQTPLAPVSVTAATVDGTAVAGTDFVGNSQLLSWTALDAVLTRTITVTVNGSGAYSPDKSFSVALGSPLASVTIVVPDTVTTTITSTKPKVTIASAVLPRPASGTSIMAFSVSLNRPATVPVSVVASTSDGTAIAGVDYVATSQTLTFSPGQQSLTALVTILSSSSAGTKQFTMTLGSLDPAIDAAGSALTSTGTITGPGLPKLKLTVLGSNTVTNPGLVGAVPNTTLVTFQITRSGTTGSLNRTSTVQWETSGGTAVGCATVPPTNLGSPPCNYVIEVPTLVTFLPGETVKTVTVTVVGVKTSTIPVSGGRKFTVLLANPTGSLLVSPSKQIIKIIR